MVSLPNFVRGFSRPRIATQTLSTKEVRPIVSVRGAIHVNLGWLENWRSIVVHRHGSSCAQNSKILPVTGRLLLLNALVGPLFATFGVAVMADSFVVIGIDSQITGVATRLDCKMRHNTTTAIISSGTYHRYNPGGLDFDVFDWESLILYGKKRVPQVFDELDGTMQTTYKRELLRFFFKDPFAYLERYRDIPVAEFIVGGFDNNGMWMGKFGYLAPNPGRFSEQHFRFTKPTGGQLRIGTVPSVQMANAVPTGYWNINPAPNQSIEAAIIERVTGFIKMRIKIDRTVSEPISVSVIDRTGFKFVDRGACDSSAKP